MMTIKDHAGSSNTPDNWSKSDLQSFLWQKEKKKKKHPEMAGNRGPFSGTTNFRITMRANYIKNVRHIKTL